MSRTNTPRDRLVGVFAAFKGLGIAGLYRVWMFDDRWSMFGYNQELKYYLSQLASYDPGVARWQIVSVEAIA